MKFRNFLLFALIGLFLINIVIADQEICIDFDDPSPPEYLEVTISGDNIILEWPKAHDEPECSGIDYYNIFRNGMWIKQVDGDVLTYTDVNVPYGTYSYSVFAVDLVGHESNARANSITISAPIIDNGGSPGGRRSSSYVCYENWECTPWSECIDGVMVRTCTDLNKCGTTKDKPQISSTCSPDEEEEISLGEPSEESFFSKITGAAIGGITDFAKSGIGLIIAILIIAAGVVVLFITKKKK